MNFLAFGANFICIWIRIRNTRSNHTIPAQYAYPEPSNSCLKRQIIREVSASFWRQRAPRISNHYVFKRRLRSSQKA